MLNKEKVKCVVSFGEYLAEGIELGMQARVFLSNGVRLEGKVLEVQPGVLVLSRIGFGTQLVNPAHIATISEVSDD